ncbi:hypothetical protein IP92_01119 [Pseudoduganella flava]|uniref:Esterase-like activity of phytase family protein n=1 Tax=Pseudoduganella flava TaxID=871742 RepID=A0A562Q0P9_9BURK|nr:esterase-like activity of phytase family protein [Pseudoduganella flava]QGZ38545.1 esterase-like activity of phytase family protein [Pseudoduganella flava]TWI49896.1 hypothetical protein IP92_01119 [Pseudoduganella flava]
MKSFTRLAGAVGVAGLLAACSVAGHPGHSDRRADTRDVAALRFIGEQRIALKTRFAGTTVGGISGVDYDARRGDWVFVSDDRSSFDPARFYRATLRFTPTSFDAVTLTDVHYFRQGDGSTYPDVKRQAVAGGVVADIESVRVDPRDGSIWYSSEGDRRLGLDPFVRQAGADGALRAELPLPPMFKVHPDAERGVRNNLAFEGLAFAPDGASLWVAMEAPLYEDGPLPTPQHGALARITHVDRAGRVLAQYAYPVDPIPATPGDGKPADNGISEITATGPHTLLVLERSAVQGEDGSYRNYIRLYEADVRGATDVATLPALAGAAVAPVAKRLVLDFNTLGLPVLDNVEAFGFGPQLPNGHATLLFVTDDNFSKNQVTQLLLFEVLPPHVSDPRP